MISDKMTNKAGVVILAKKNWEIIHFYPVSFLCRVIKIRYIHIIEFSTIWLSIWKLFILIILGVNGQIACASKESRGVSLTVISVPCVQSLRRGLHVTLKKDIAVDGRRH